MVDEPKDFKIKIDAPEGKTTPGAAGRFPQPGTDDGSNGVNAVSGGTPGSQNRPRRSRRGGRARTEERTNPEGSANPEGPNRAGR